MKSLRSFLIASCTLAALCNTVAAHVGSSDVFYEGNAGPYRLFVNVTMPQVIPGVAEIGIRSETPGLTDVRTAITTLRGAGADFAPTPDVAIRSKQDPQFFSSSLWLMQPGALRILALVEGAQGKGQISVPLPSFAQRTLTMDPLLSLVLLAMLTTLAISMLFIIASAFREGGLKPGEAASPELRRQGLIAAMVTAAIIGWSLVGGFRWWSQEASNYDAVRKFFQPPQALVTASNGILTVTPADKEWSQKVDFSSPLSDHGHPMHLFLLRTPGLDELLHLHPEPSGDGSFAIRLPAVDAGSYRVFADIVDGSGFPWTLVGEINLPKSDLPKSSGAPQNGDDSGAVADVISETRSAAASTVSRLPDGGAMYWERDNSPLKAGLPLKLKFRVVNRVRQPATDLEPYMGMAAHAVIVRSDLSVFAHVHPSGSVPMASLMLVSAAEGKPESGMEMKSHAGMAMGGMAKGDTPIGSEISLPYGFPSPGEYRLFVQVKRAGHIETGVFDTHIEQ